MTSLDIALAGVARVGIDSGPLIYLVESHPIFEAIPVELARRATSGHLELVTSMISLTEVLVHPYRLGSGSLVAEYRDVLLNDDNNAVTRSALMSPAL